MIFHAVKSLTVHLNFKLVYSCKQHQQSREERQACRPEGKFRLGSGGDLLARKIITLTMHECAIVEIRDINTLKLHKTTFTIITCIENLIIPEVAILKPWI